MYKIGHITFSIACPSKVSTQTRSLAVWRVFSTWERQPCKDLQWSSLIFIFFFIVNEALHTTENVSPSCLHIQHRLNTTQLGNYFYKGGWLHLVLWISHLYLQGLLSIVLISYLSIQVIFSFVSHLPC